MKQRDRGTIIQILSAISYRGVPLQSAYSTTKHGLRGFTEVLRAELLNDRSAVHVTMVHPPSVNTPFYSHTGSVMDEAPRPPPPVYQPEIIGEAIYMAGVQKRRGWRVTGETVGFSIANKIAPACWTNCPAWPGWWVPSQDRFDQLAGTEALADLLPRALLRRLVRPPAHQHGPVAESAVGHLVVADLDHQLGAELLPGD